MQWTPNASTQQSGSGSSYSSSQQNQAPEYSGATSQVCLPLCMLCTFLHRLHSPVKGQTSPESSSRKTAT